MSNKSFGENTDPGFLAAKGRFRVPAEKDRSKLFQDRDILLKGGRAGDDVAVVALTKGIDALGKLIDKDRENLESQHVKKLANAIIMTTDRNGYANVRAIGMRATYNAIKSICLASLYCNEKGIRLIWESTFDRGNLGDLRSPNHVEKVSAMFFKLKKVEEEDE